MDKCQICGEESPDLRTLKIDYFYQLDEVSPKFKRENNSRLFSIKTCKNCRGEFLAMLGHWAKGAFVAKRERSSDHNIPVRVMGRTVMMNRQEWEEYTAQKGEPGRQPVVLKDIPTEEENDADRRADQSQRPSVERD
jgi:hypothetical protein